MIRENFQKFALLILVIGISLIFFFMIRSFLITLLLAGIFAGMLQWLYQKLLTPFREHKSLASGVTTLVFVLIVVVPLLGLFGIVVDQALQISRSSDSWASSAAAAAACSRPRAESSGSPCPCQRPLAFQTDSAWRTRTNRVELTAARVDRLGPLAPQRCGSVNPRQT